MSWGIVEGLKEGKNEGERGIGKGKEESLKNLGMKGICQKDRGIHIIMLALVGIT